MKVQSKDMLSQSDVKSSKSTSQVKGVEKKKKRQHHEKESKDYYKDLVLSVNQWFDEREIKVKPDQIFRKHISWKYVIASMSSKGHGVKDLNEIKRHWFEVCRFIKVERPLTEILSECDQAIEKLFKIPTQSGYSIFQLEHRPKLVEKYPELKFIELHQKLAKRWNKLGEDERKKFNDLAAEQNRKNGVGVDRSKKRKSGESNKVETPVTVETYSYPTTALRDFYISLKAAELKKSNPDLSYKKRRALSSAEFTKCSFNELTDIKKLYAEHLQQFIEKVNHETPEFVSKIGQHIMSTKKLRPLLEQPVISRFLSNISLNNTSTADNHTHESSDSSDSDDNVVEKYENSSLSSEDVSDDNN